MGAGGLGTSGQRSHRHEAEYERSGCHVHGEDGRVPRVCPGDDLVDQGSEESAESEEVDRSPGLLTDPAFEVEPLRAG